MEIINFKDDLNKMLTGKIKDTPTLNMRDDACIFRLNNWRGWITVMIPETEKIKSRQYAQNKESILYTLNGKRILFEGSSHRERRRSP
jgi:hypothetical protein